MFQVSNFSDMFFFLNRLTGRQIVMELCWNGHIYHDRGPPCYFDYLAYEISVANSGYLHDNVSVNVAYLR